MYTAEYIVHLYLNCRHCDLPGTADGALIRRGRGCQVQQGIHGLIWLMLPDDKLQLNGSFVGEGHVV